MTQSGASRRRSRRLAVGGIALAVTLATAACGAGQVAETDVERPTLDGTEGDVGVIALRGVSIDAPTGVSYAAGSDASMRLVLVNRGKSVDSLTRVSSPSVTGWSSFDAAGADAPSTPASSASGTPSSGLPSSGLPTTGTQTAGSPTGAGTSAAESASGPAQVGGSTRPVAIAPGQRTSFGTPDSTRVLELVGIRSRLHPGSTIRMTFTFARAGSVTLVVPVSISNSPEFSFVPGPSSSSDAG